MLRTPGASGKPVGVAATILGCRRGQASLPPGKNLRKSERLENSLVAKKQLNCSAGLPRMLSGINVARLYGRQDARRYFFSSVLPSNLSEAELIQ